MKPTDCAVHGTTFLTHDLAAQRHLRPNTSTAYRDVFTRLLRFCRAGHGLAPARLRLEQIDVSCVEAFLADVERERRSAPTTRNPRLAALHAFCRFVQAEEPDRLLQCQHSLAIPQRRHARPTVGSLSKADWAALVAQPDLSTREGRRDAVLLSVLYDTGARVQEMIALSAGDRRLAPPAQVRLLGKGRQMRAVPFLAQTVQLLRAPLHEHPLDRPEPGDRPVFQNEQHQLPGDDSGLLRPRGCQNDADLRESASREETQRPGEHGGLSTAPNDPLLATEPDPAGVAPLSLTLWRTQVTRSNRGPS
jgi:integrase/recombinase XerD